MTAPASPLAALRAEMVRALNYGSHKAIVTAAQKCVPALLDALDHKDEALRECIARLDSTDDDAPRHVPEYVRAALADEGSP